MYAAVFTDHPDVDLRLSHLDVSVREFKHYAVSCGYVTFYARHWRQLISYSVYMLEQYPPICPSVSLSTVYHTRGLYQNG